MNSIAPDPQRYRRAESHMPRIGGVVSVFPAPSPDGLSLRELALAAYEEAQQEARQQMRREAEAIRAKQAEELAEACRRILRVGATASRVEWNEDGHAVVNLDGYTFRGGCARVEGKAHYWLKVADAFGWWHDVTCRADLGLHITERELVREVPCP